MESAVSAPRFCSHATATTSTVLEHDPESAPGRDAARVDVAPDFAERQRHLVRHRLRRNRGPAAQEPSTRRIVDARDSACPLHAHWLDGQAITSVLAMSGIADRYRRFVLDGAPIVTGLLPSPMHGRVPIHRPAVVSQLDFFRHCGCGIRCARPAMIHGRWSKNSIAEPKPSGASFC